jgi:hypothetical protein
MCELREGGSAMKTVNPSTTRQEANAWLLSFESVKRWLGTETIRSEHTRRIYLYHFWLLLDHLRMTPDEFLAERIKDMPQQDYVARTRMEQKVRDYKTELERTRGKQVGFLMTAAACSFLKSNTGARLNINNPPPDPEQEVFIYEAEPDKEQGFWRNIVDHAPTIRDAACFLIGLESGPRDGSLLHMTIADVTNEFSNGAAPYKITVPPPGESHTKKRGGFNFIAEDARRKIETYLDLRKSRFGPYQASDSFLVDLETGRPLTHFDTVNDALRKAFLDAGALSRDQVYPPDVRMSPVRWYCLRKRAQTIMEDNTDGTGIALNWVDELLSHRKRGAQAAHYSKPTVQQLRGAYAKAMHRLMIYKEPKANVSDDELDRRIMQRWNALGEKITRELMKTENQIVTAGQIARILREATAISKETE